MDTTLGELLVAGLLKDPEDAGRIIADAIVQAEAGIGAETVTKAEPKPEAKITAPSASTSRVPSEPADHVSATAAAQANRHEALGPRLRKGCKVKIHSKDFRVPEGEEVSLKKWPTDVEPLYKSTKAL